MKRLRWTMLALGVSMAVGCPGADEGTDTMDIAGANDMEAYDMLATAVGHLLEDYEREDARLLAAHGRTGERAAFPDPEPPHDLAFIPFAGGMPRQAPQPSREEMVLRDGEGKVVDRIPAREARDPLIPGSVEAWDALAAAMRTTEAWEYSPPGWRVRASDPPPDPHTMILRLDNLEDRDPGYPGPGDPGLYAGVEGDGVHYTIIASRPPWFWFPKSVRSEGRWVRSEVWLTHFLRVERADGGWR